MPDMNQGSQSQPNSGETDFAAVKALLTEVETVSTTLHALAEALQSSYHSEGLLDLSRRFEKISQQFTTFAQFKSHRFYRIIHRSASHLSVVQRIAHEASRLTVLFEKYARSPNDFSVATCRVQINRLQAALVDLGTTLS
jgi:hypothetical protein